MLTTYERGIIAGQREMALSLLEATFGPLSAEAKRRVEALSQEQLIQLVVDAIHGRSLKELHLED